MRRLLACYWLLWLIGTLSVSAQVLPFVSVAIDRETPYVGEKLRYTLRVYTTETLGHSRITEPSFYGFGRSRLVNAARNYTDTLDNITYQVVEQDYILYPLRAGEWTIDPFRIDLEATPFSEAQTLLSDAITLQVSALPEPQPASFINAIGQFDMHATVTPTQLTSGDAIQLQVTITGTGNIEQVRAPLIDLPQGWRLLQGNSRYQQDTEQFGTREFEWSIIAYGDGTVTMPEIVFSYFDPQADAYETVTTASVDLRIQAADAYSDDTSSVARTPIVLTPLPIPALMQANRTQLPRRPPFWFWLLWLIAPLLALGVGGRRVLRSWGRESGRMATRQSTQRQALKHLYQQLKIARQENPKRAYERLLDALLTYLGAKAGDPVTIATYPKALEHYSQRLQVECKRCLEDAQEGQYAPITADDVEQLAQRVARVCVALEKASR